MMPNQMMDALITEIRHALDKKLDERESDMRADLNKMVRRLVKDQVAMMHEAYAKEVRKSLDQRFVDWSNELQAREDKKSGVIRLSEHEIKTARAKLTPVVRLPKKPAAKKGVVVLSEAQKAEGKRKTTKPVYLANGAKATAKLKKS